MRTRSLKRWAVTLLVLASMAACGGGDRAPERVGPWVLAPTSSAYLQFLSDEAAGRELPEVAPSPFAQADFEHVLGAIVPAKIVAPGLCELPSAYDLRALGRISPARVGTDRCGTCWTGATLVSLESTLATTSVDFSESHLALNYGRDNASCGQSGHSELPVAYLAAWKGPVNESDFDEVARSTTPPVVQRHVQDVLFFPDRAGPRDNCLIKLAIMNLGALYTSISRTTFAAGFFNHGYYYNPQIDSSVHAVGIVGWDDNFDRTRFFCADPNVSDDQRVPPGNGAFIVKDNAGPGPFDQGFYYVSYYDASIGQSLSMYLTESRHNYSRKYEHDPYGPTSYMYVPGAQKAASWQANVFVAEDNEWLAAVSINEPWMSDMDYQVRVYLDPVDSHLAMSAPVAVIDYSMAFPGYRTLVLPERVRLRKGQKFAVIVRGQNRTGGFPGPIMIERPDPRHTKIQAGAGESFVSTDGCEWIDLTTVSLPQADGPDVTLSNCNVCIKAFTQPLIDATATLGDIQNVLWAVRNDDSAGAWLRPQVRQYERAGTARRELELPTPPIQASIEGLVVESDDDGWYWVPAGKQLDAQTGDDSFVDADQIAVSTQTRDASDTARQTAPWQYILNTARQLPLQVHMSSPDDGETQPASEERVIEVTFDRALIAGPQLHKIRVASDTKVYRITPHVTGRRLLISTAAFTASESGGTTVRVSVPTHAVLSAAEGNPLASLYTFSFQVR